MGIVIRNECCECAVPAYPCRGDICPLRHVRRLYCDNCGADVDRLYVLDGDELCEECVLKRLEVVE